MGQENNSLWMEKYRPKTVKQIVLPTKVKKTINKIINSGILPNLLIYDPKPGGGKSSLAKSICNDMGLDEVMYENGSGDVNIDFLRTNVTQFAQTWSMSGKVKVVIIDDIGKGSAAFLDGLKVFSEKYSESCRFIITTNSLSFIPGPIKSRFELIEFNFQDPDVKTQMQTDLKKYFTALLKKLEVPCAENALENLISKCYPDIRSVMKCLQLEYLENGQITESVIKIVSVDKEFYMYLLEKQLTNARRYLIEKNVDYQSMYGKMFREFIPMIESKAIQAQCILKIEKYMNDHTTSIDPEITFTALLIEIMSMM